MDSYHERQKRLWETAAETAAELPEIVGAFDLEPMVDEVAARMAKQANESGIKGQIFYLMTDGGLSKQQILDLFRPADPQPEEIDGH